MDKFYRSKRESCLLSLEARKHTVRQSGIPTYRFGGTFGIVRDPRIVREVLVTSDFSIKKSSFLRQNFALNFLIWLPVEGKQGEKIGPVVK